MIYLKMILKQMLIEQVPIPYEGLQSCQEKEDYHVRIAAELCAKHERKIILTGAWPQFFIEAVPSKMNTE